jgi:hypothetical protein
MPERIPFINLNDCGRFNDGEAATLMADGAETTLAELKAGIVEGKSAPAELMRRAVLVFPGTFMSSNAGAVTVTEKDLASLAASINAVHLDAGGDVALGFPVQKDHSQSVDATVGRLKSSASVETVELSDGAKVKGLVSNVTVLGRENTVKAIDGRWKSLSLSFFRPDSGFTVKEVSFVAFPAADGAALLSEAPTGMHEDLWEVVGPFVELAAARDRWEVDSVREHMVSAVRAFTMVIESFFADREDLSDEEQSARAEQAVEDLLAVISERVKGIWPMAELSYNKEATQMGTVDDKKKREDEVAELAAANAELAELRARNTMLEQKNLASDIQRGLDWLVAGKKILPATAKAVDVAELAKGDRKVAEAMLGAWSQNADVVELGARGNETTGSGGKGEELSPSEKKELAKDIRERIS